MPRPPLELVFAEGCWQRLTWYRKHQDTIRRDTYEAVQQHSQSSAATSQRFGQRVILPPSFTGGPRNMQQLYHDGMAIVRKVGKADLFVTFTANAHWPEVQEALRGKTRAVPFARSQVLGCTGLGLQL